MKEIIHSGTWSEDRITDLLKEASMILSPGERIGFLSGKFLNTAYQESTLKGDILTPEVLVINLEGVDCFTFIEYVEAMRRSRSFDEFRRNLPFVRYRSGIISYDHRNHFFTDWKAFNAEFVVDVTQYTGADKTKDITKRLNEKHDGTLFLPGIACRLREVTCIPSSHVDDTVMGNLQTGDYAGIYSKEDGLDVSHVGIVIRKEDGVYLRHASSLKKHRKVVDEGLRGYLKSKAGIIVLRPRD